MSVVHVTSPTGQSINLSVRRGSISAIEDNRTAYTFDDAGRLVNAFVGGRTYRRSLANDVLEKGPGTRPGLAYRSRRFLTLDEVERLVDGAYHFAQGVAQALRQHSGHAPPDADRALAQEALGRVATYNFHRLQIERETYQAIYQRVPIMPPDQYLALALQATEGCSFNACSFCGFYRDRRFHAKTGAQFQAHINQVKAFLGRGLALRKSIFLGDANALLLPQPVLLDVFDRLNEAFNVIPPGLTAEDLKVWRATHQKPMDGVYSFVDAFSTRRKSAGDFAQLAERGLRRVYVGLETGDAELLKFLGKPNGPEDVVDLVARLKQAGLGVGVIILAGAGGQPYASQHTTHTAALINRLALGTRDVIYFSELVDYPGSDYRRQADAAGLHPMSVEETDRQMQAMRAQFRFDGPPPIVSFYDVREFVY